MYLGSLEELIQNLRQGWVCMNGKLDVLQGTNGYVKIQAFYHYADSTNATKLTKSISNSLAHEFQGQWHLMPRGRGLQHATPKCELQEFLRCQDDKSSEAKRVNFVNSKLEVTGPMKSP